MSFSLSPPPYFAWQVRRASGGQVSGMGLAAKGKKTVKAVPRFTSLSISILPPRFGRKMPFSGRPFRDFCLQTSVCRKFALSMMLKFSGSASGLA